MRSPKAFPEFLQIPGANALHSPFGSDSISCWTSYLTHFSPPEADLFLCSKLSQIQDSVPLFHALSNRKHTHTHIYMHSLKTLCAHQTFLKVWKDWGVITTLLGPFILFKCFSHCVCVIGRERNPPYIIQNNLALHSLFSDFQWPIAGVTHSMNHPLQVLSFLPLISTEEQKEVLNFHSPLPFCSGKGNGIIFSPMNTN